MIAAVLIGIVAFTVAMFVISQAGRHSESDPASPASPIAQQTETALLDGWGVDSLQAIPSDLKGATAITEFEDVSSDTVRVYVQENLSDADRDALAKMIYGLVHETVPELRTIVVRDPSGTDSNHFF